MKKLVLVLVVALIAVPSFAAVTLTESDKVDTTVTVGYDATGEPLPRGFGLVLQATGGTITSVTATKTGESTAALPGYGIFPGTIDLTDVNNPVWNTPVEPNDFPGGPSVLGTSRVVVALGSLYVGDTNRPGATGTLFQVVCSAGTTKLTVSEEDAFRGGVVDVNANPLTVAAIDINFPVAPTECYKTTSQDYAAWVAFGKPDCWCFQRQCRGDINGTKNIYWVQLLDLNALKAAFGKTDAQLLLITNGICADLNHTKNIYRVQLLDLNVLKTYFGKTEALVPVCDANLVNFWTN